MTERELRAVAEAIAEDIYNQYGRPELVYDKKYEGKLATFYGVDIQKLAQKAIFHSDSRHVKGLVEALKEARNALQFVSHFDSEVAHDDTDETVTEIVIKSIDIALQNLPEDRR